MRICLLLFIFLVANSLFAGENIFCFKTYVVKYTDSFLTIARKNKKQQDSSIIYIDSLTIVSKSNIGLKISIDKITRRIDSSIMKMSIPYFYRLEKDNDIHSSREKASDYYYKKGPDTLSNIVREIYTNFNLSEYQACGYFNLKTKQPLLIYFIVLQEQSDMDAPLPPYEVYNYFFNGKLIKKIYREFPGYFSSTATIIETTWYYEFDKIIVTKIKSTKKINQTISVNNLYPFGSESNNQNNLKNGISKFTLNEFKNCKEKFMRTRKEMIKEIKVLKKNPQTTEE